MCLYFSGNKEKIKIQVRPVELPKYKGKGSGFYAGACEMHDAIEASMEEVDVIHLANLVQEARDEWWKVDTNMPVDKWVEEYILQRIKDV